MHEAYLEQGNIDNAVLEYEDDLSSIRDHLIAIADAWDAASDALEIALDDDDATVTFLVAIIGISAFVSLVSVIVYRRQKA